VLFSRIPAITALTPRRISDVGIGAPHGMAVRSGVLSGAAVPEPFTYALLCISLGVVGYARKKMRIVKGEE
jgi:hypothetical protein